MKIISQQEIKNLRITAKQCCDWIRESFSIKQEAQLPAKISCHPADFDFFTSMPCLLPEDKEGNRFFGIKEVHRIKGAVPSLGSDMMLYDAKSGELVALLDTDWITTMRTGAVAAVSAQALRKLIKGGHVKTFMKWIKEMTYCKWKLKNTINEAETFLDSLNVSDGCFYIFPFSYSNVINRYPIEWFSETIEMPFENIMVKMASGYDKILKQQYGDYMTLPPIEKRITHHSYYFIDLNRKVSKDEIKEMRL